ncbi:MAG TPA: hypothetical protein VMS88_07520 [Terriglobales bacterium]|nr:hypothetical protein [Terriglobales bacterium]
MTSATARVALRSAPGARSRRLAAPILVALWALLGIEAAGGLVIYCARIAFGTTPGEAFHVAAGLALLPVWIVYQWNHWLRVRPLRPLLDYTVGLLAASSMALTNLTGVALGALWWRDRVARALPAARVPAALSAAHLSGTMLVLTFVGAHVGAVLLRDARARGRR